MLLPVRRGVYIAIDGIEGSGKTTQVERVAERLRTGFRVAKVRKPYLLEVRGCEGEGVDAEAEVCLYVADRIIIQRD